MSQEPQQFNMPPEIGRWMQYSKQIIAGVLVLVLLASGIFQVGTEEVGVITAFGKYSRTI